MISQYPHAICINFQITRKMDPFQSSPKLRKYESVSIIFNELEMNYGKQSNKEYMM